MKIIPINMRVEQGSRPHTTILPTKTWVKNDELITRQSGIGEGETLNILKEVPIYSRTGSSFTQISGVTIPKGTYKILGFYIDVLFSGNPYIIYYYVQTK